VELLKQPQYSPLAVEEQVVAIFLGTKGHLDSVPAQDVQRFEAEFLEHVKASHEEVYNGIRESKKLPEDAADQLTTIVNDFKKGFAATDGSSVVDNEADAESLDPDDVEKESVKVRKSAPKKN
jgi:F-type H+-transporting ATPase subunit alpha